MDQTVRLQDGRILAYTDLGDPKGKPLMFFHGWPSSRLRANLFHEAAKSAGVRLISPDRPGYGKSDFKQNRRLVDWSDDVVQLADHLGFKKFAVVGVSGGGPYAAVTAYKIPERLTRVGIVVGLSPTNVPGILEDLPFTYKFTWANYSKFPILAKLGCLYCLIQSRYLPFLAVFQWKAKEDRLVLARYQQQELKAGNVEAFRRGINGPMQDLLIYSSEWGFDVSKIQSKVFLWYGQTDKNVTLAMGKYYNSKISGSTLKIYPHEGHFISLTHAEEIFKTLAN